MVLAFFWSHSCSALHSQHLWMMALANQATYATFLKGSGEFPCCNKPIEHQKVLKDVGKAKKQRAPATLSHGAALASLAWNQSFQQSATSRLKGRSAHSVIIDFKPPRIEILELCLMDLASSKHWIFRKLKTRTEVKGNPVCTYKIRANSWKSATTNSWDQALPCRCAFVSGTDSTLANAQEAHGQRTVFPTWQSLKPRRWYLENGRIWEVRRQICTDTAVSGTWGSCPLSPPMGFHPSHCCLIFRGK